jgi:3,4-dihydroxy 2-butanone 4-phosphate synthase/GTP cyclohydrolase II
MANSDDKSRPQELRVVRMVHAKIPTAMGKMCLYLYTSNRDDKEHLAAVFGDVAGQRNVLVRVHSECFTGEVLGSRRCDCGPQLQEALNLMAQAECGVLVYLRQEGRGIGLLEKLRAYNLQDEGYDTVDANLKLGHQADEREYGVGALILKDLGVRSIRLLTNNLHKYDSLLAAGIEICERLPLQIGIHADNTEYMRTKAKRMNHQLPIDLLLR